GKKINTNDEIYIYESGKIFNEDKNAVTLTGAFKGTVESGVVSVDGSAVTSALNITGNSENNLIYGGTKNDTLNGGAGNDTLTGGNGNDTFIASSGNDLITDYTAGKDKIKISSEFTWNISGNDVVFSTADGSLTVKDGAGKEITTLDSKNKSTKQIYSAASARTFDLFYDNNFLADENNLDSITEQKFSVTEIQPAEDKTFAQDDKILIFAKDK
ncbi:MAG: hypothetical protein IJT73_07325, partial [Selenomonadaceae bacterium]|nr:hypothetical protein [Selenomonadaceae bacterium]